MNSMTAADYIALIALFFSVVSFVVSLLANRRKYELTTNARNEIMEWYSATITCLVQLRMKLDDNYSAEKEKDLRGTLSAQIEIGRFFFPNRADQESPKDQLVYHGKRSIVTQLLILLYDTYKTDDAPKYHSHVYHVQGLFTYEVMRAVSPISHNRYTGKYTRITIDDKTTIESYLKRTPIDPRAYSKLIELWNMHN